MTELQIKQLDELRCRISRLNKLLSALNGTDVYSTLFLDDEDENYIRNYADKKIEELDKQIEEL